MKARFRSYVESLEPLLRQLLAMEPLKIMNLPRNMPKAGIYLFSERGRHLYVGRSNRLRARLQEHGRPSATHNSAPFAFALARRATSRMKATYTAAGSREALQADPRFRSAFKRSKDRVRRMDVRYVAEADPIRQALLEVYVALALDTPFNDFDTH